MNIQNTIGTMKKLCILLMACLPLTGMAADNKKDNTDPKYLSGAVTYADDGKVCFTHEIQAPSLSKEQIYQLMMDWSNKRFQPDGKLTSKVVYANETDGQIAAAAEEYLVFSSSALSLDRTRVYYQFLVNAQQGACRLTMTRIRYWYDENRDGGHKYTAEEWINDDMALNKKKTKLAPVCGKFRRETIELKDDLFQSATAALGQQALAQAPVQAAPVAIVQPTVTLNATEELKEVAINQLPANLNEVAANGRITLTAANGEEIDLKADNWGGFGQLFGKNVAYVLIDQSRIAASALMEQSDTYTVSIYAQGHTTPGIVIECRKSMSQKLSADELKSVRPDADTSRSYTMYMGEVTRTLMR